MSTAAERDAIRSQLERYYRGPDHGHPWFNFRFELTLPEESPSTLGCSSI